MPRAAAVPAQEIVDLPARLLLRREGELQVRPVEGVHHHLRRLREELLAMSACVCRSAVAVSAVTGHIAERLARLGEQAVFGAEIMPPLRDAMRLVDGEPRHAEPRAGARPGLPRPAARARRRAAATRRR